MPDIAKNREVIDFQHGWRTQNARLPAWDATFSQRQWNRFRCVGYCSDGVWGLVRWMAAIRPALCGDLRLFVRAFAASAALRANRTSHTETPQTNRGQVREAFANP